MDAPPMIAIPNNAVLVVIDVQKGFDDPVWGKRNNHQAEENIARLLKIWRKRKQPVFHVQHLSLSPGSPLRADYPGCEIEEIVKPLDSEPLFQNMLTAPLLARISKDNCGKIIIHH
jgi:nicotinamidase-related amidase